ncbi:hypothetical protein DFP72DRAFT_1004463 [Ephemerocybe angulata]|uniref:F-box domain-containing protein n=1 Tax=Ephemerocybe angulata TaxID=980116 RepID=A0A8H6I6L0_9AGAR|nr:hypothetical protein DFP72DRAFT_1004463 [Tulosesus angulatus]
MAPKWTQMLQPSPPEKPADGLEAAEARSRRPSFTERIARAFSKNEPRRCTEQPGRLFSLPFELLDQIFDEVASKKDLCNLRRTCIELNEYLLERVFEELIIDSVARGSHSTGYLLKALSSGKAPACSALTKTLRIHNLLIFSAPSQSNWQNPNQDARLVPLQGYCIAPALKALDNLKRVYWNLKIKDPYSIMAEALATLPSLEELHITFDHWVPTSHFPFEKFSHLKLLSLEQGDYKLSLSHTVTAALKKAIQASPGLTDLRLGVEIEFGQPSLGDLLSEAPGVRLTHVRALDSYWCKGQYPWDALSNLTSIDMPNNLSSSTSAIWAALTARRVQLSSVSVHDISPALVAYLKSYSGLQSLYVKKAGSSLDVELPWTELAGEVYLRILPLHRFTLRTFWVEAGFRWSDAEDPFVLRPQYLDAVLQCSQLRKLSVPLYYHKRWLGISNSITPASIKLADYLNSLTNLRYLREVHIALACAMNAGGMELIQLSKHALYKELMDMRVPDQETFKFRIRLFDEVLGLVRLTRKDPFGNSVYCFRPRVSL